MPITDRRKVSGLMPERQKLKVSTRVMYDEFRRQDIPVRIIDATASLLEFTDNSSQPRLLFSTSSDRSSAVGLSIADNKVRTRFIANELGITVPADLLCYSFDDALAFLAEYKCIVLKPLGESGGKGVTTNIKNAGELKQAYAYALEYGKSIIAQQHIQGIDTRLLIVAGHFRSAILRRPASITGDGVMSTEELIIQANDSPFRTDGYMTAMSLIDTASAGRFLADTISFIPAKDEVVIVVGPANLSMGGTAHEATHLVSEQMIADAEKITRKLRLALCGVDMIWDQETGEYFLIEVNATPGIDMHNDPLWGTSSDAVEHYVRWLIQPNATLVAT